MSKKETAAPLRVDLYIRVSGQEQAIKGLSLEAQQEDLAEYARERGWVIVGVYIGAAKMGWQDPLRCSGYVDALGGIERLIPAVLIRCPSLRSLCAHLRSCTNRLKPF